MRNQNFGQVNNAYARLVKIENESDKNGVVIINQDLNEDFSSATSLIVCEIYRENGQWFYKAIGEPEKGGLAELCKKYGIDVE